MLDAQTTTLNILTKGLLRSDDNNSLDDIFSVSWFCLSLNSFSSSFLVSDGKKAL